MGGCVYRIGDYQALIKDYEYPKTYDDDDNPIKQDPAHIINVKLTNLLSGQEKEVQARLDELENLTPDGFFDEKMKRNPSHWLYERLRFLNRPILIIPSLSLHIGNAEAEVLKNMPRYYLNTDIMDENIQIITHPRIFEINDISELDWLASKGLSYCGLAERKRYFEARGI